ncbi:Disease resistance protein RGA2 [Carex littledalei]|uniref:Disease resistance protein RGA2 n=1 Tax=Carex littledalei TaxID=544730 RepID=A0A833VLG3_9POAL|nr:Disease resistance protein RGA2 [Carex littledalei]
MEHPLSFVIENIAENLIGELYNSANSLVGDHLSCGKEFKEQLKSLDSQLPKVKAVVNAINKGGLGLQESDADLRKWSWQFKNAVEAAEDVLDEMEYNKIDEQLHSKDVSVSSTSNYWFSSIYCGIKRKFDEYLGNSRSVKNETAERLKKVVDELNNVIRGMQPFLNLELPSIDARRQEHENFLSSRECAGLETGQFIGREKEKQQIIDWVMKNEDDNPRINVDKNIHAYTIVGVGGMGKTALAQFVKNDSRLKERFDLILWVCVSTKFDVSRITKDIIQDINKEQILPQSLHVLQETLKGQLLLKRFFLVLDDVWNVDNRLQWDKLMAPLKFAKKGSKILVTSRMNSVAETIANVIETKNEVLILKGLEDKDYLPLFNSYAFAGPNSECRNDLKLIGDEIAKQLGGCPLAAKILGDQLNRNKHECYWDSILNEQIKINADKKEDRYKAILRLSYQKLDTSLQRCFTFCSIFPKGFIFEKDELIYMWIGSGLIPEKSRNLEDTGRENIDDLAKHSFFRKLNGSTSCYVMHDLLHDVARSVSVEECWSIEDGPVNTSFTETIRHLYISADAKDDNLFDEIAQLKKLRTLIIAFKGDDPQESHVALLSTILAELNSLRVLGITASFSCKLPDEIGSLIHLRHLSIHQTTNGSKLDWFPEAVYKLYNLRVLRFSGGSGGDYAGVNVKGLTNLINLRHLEIPRTIKDRIPYIGNLAQLQGSVNFHVRKDDGYKITELKNLTGIRELCIFSLEKIGSFREAKEVNLFKKERLRSLKLIWSNDSNRDPEDDKRAADVLCSPVRLRELTIKGYNGKMSPCWVTMFSEKTFFLTSISLIKCRNWSELPDLTQLPLLKFLQIKDVGLISVPKISGATSSNQEASPSLEKLEIKYCQELKNLHQNGFKNVNSLRSLCIGECPNLTIPEANAELLLPTILEHLSIGSGRNLELPLLNSLVHLTSLKSLSLENCATITTLPNADVFAKLTALMTLKIKKCRALESLGGIEALPSLHFLTIFECNKLIDVSLTQLPSYIGTNSIDERNMNSILTLKILNIDKESLLSLEPLRNLIAVEEIKVGKASDASTLRALEVSMRNLSSLRRLYICNATQKEEDEKASKGKETILIQKGKRTRKEPISIEYASENESEFKSEDNEDAKDESAYDDEDYGNEEDLF